MDRKIPSSPGTIDDVTQRLLLWIGRGNPGIAKVEYSSEFSREAVLSRIKLQLSKDAIAFHEIQLPTCQSPQAITMFLNQALDQYDHSLVSVTGFTRAFDPKIPLADALRQLNMSREKFFNRSVQQIWWMLPIFSQNSLVGMGDLTSWFMPRLRLTEVMLPDNAAADRVISSEKPRNFEDAKIQAYKLIERFQSAIAAMLQPKNYYKPIYSQHWTY